MTGSVLLAAALAGLAAFVLVRDGRQAETRLHRMRAAEGARRGGAEAVAAARDGRPAAALARARLRTRTRLAATVAAVGLGVLVGGLTGVAVAALIGVGLPAALGRLEPRRERERARALRRQAPEIADLLAACLAAGAPLTAGAQAVAGAVGEPARAPLSALVSALHLGADPVRVWRDLAAEPGLADLARAVARSVDSGAPLGDVLPGVADDLRRVTRAEAEAAARAAGVRAVAPLGACFLPAFLLLGVVPVIASLASELVG